MEPSWVSASNVGRIHVMVESVPELLFPHHADALLLLYRGDFGLAVLGKEIIHRLS